MIVTYVLLALALRGGVGVSGVNGCAPTSEMRALASAAGYEFVGEGQSGRGAAWSCGDVNADERLDLCTVLTKGSAMWEAVCFVSRGASLKLEVIADSSEEGLGRVGRKDLSLEVIRPGHTLTWANDAAQVSLRHDCVLFGVGESTERVYCYNGATFLSMQLSD